MGDEWVCKDCGQATNEDPGNQTCLACSGEMINIGEVDEDLKKPAKPYEDDEMNVPIEKSDELDTDFEEEDEADLLPVKGNKKANLSQEE